MQLKYFTKALIIICAITCFLSATSKLYAQGNTWTQKADFAGGGRYDATGFAIGTKGYIGTGSQDSFLKDFWEYDPSTNVWTQKADFGGTGRFEATGFAIGTKGYIGTGYTYLGGLFTRDFWEYNPATNMWTQKADFGGTARSNAVGFAIGTKGYIGTGYNGGRKNDFWEYDPGTDVWTQKADFGGTARYAATGFAIGTKGYIGTGNDGSKTKDFWEYNPGPDIWMQKADFGGIARDEATGFSIGNKGYIGTGNGGPSVYYRKDFWEYDPGTDVWIQKADVGGFARVNATGFAIGTNGYIGTGADSTFSVIYRQDFWEYSPGAVLPVSLISFNGKRVINKNELNWQIADEINVAYYSLEHSRDGVNFTGLTDIHTTGNNQSTKNYSYTDLLPFSRITFYRLKIVDSDGRFKYSKIIAVKEDKEKSLIVFPNPAKDILFVQVSEENEHAIIHIIDAMGRKLKEEKLNSNTSVSIDIKDIPAGIYTLVIKNQSKTEQRRFIKQ